MNISKFILGIALFVVCLACSSNVVMGDVGGRGKQKAGVPAGGHVGKGHSAEEVVDLDVHHALEELKVLTSAVTKKTQDNRSLLIGASVANAVLLTVLTALVGYSLKDKGKKKEEESENKET